MSKKEQDDQVYQAVGILAPKSLIIGHYEHMGVYKLEQLTSGVLDGSGAKETDHIVGMTKFELDKTEQEENFMRFSFVAFHLKHLMGEVLTAVEASITNETQLKAVKSIIKGNFSKKLDWIYENCACPEEEQESLIDSDDE